MKLCFRRKVLESERQRDGEPDRARDEDDPSLSGGELDLHRQLDLQVLLQSHHHAHGLLVSQHLAFFSITRMIN